MPEALLAVSVVWIGVLVAATVVVLVRTSSPFTRILTVDTIVLLVMAFLLVLAIGRDDGVFVDAALALGLLGFTTTLALVRVEREGEER